MESVLIVDDERSIRLSLEAFLSAAGYQTTVAADAKEALCVLREKDLDVVLSDIVLPGINGIDLLKEIREASPFSQVVMMTGEPTVDTAAEALRAGAFDYLSKPVGKDAVLRSVGNAVKIKALDDERRRLEDENREYQENLERLIQQRTAELEQANVSLEETLTELRAAHTEMIRHERMNALAQLAAGICHDFNNVLMPICGLADYLVTNPKALDDRAETVRLLEMIQSATEDAKDIVKRMREFYRPRDEMEMEPIDVCSLNSVVELSRPKWETHAQNEGRNIRVVLEDVGVQEIIGNEQQLREALTNLVLNAVDATPGDGTIALSALSSVDSVTIAVKDSGHGMPKAIRERCLEPFFTTKGEGGTGMGLAMVHGIAKRHGGWVEISSEEGVGTIFGMCLPLLDRTRTREDSGTSPSSGSGTSLRILVIDDEELSRMLVQKYLVEAGHTVDLASGGEEGVAKVVESTYDMVITDRAMPGMNGDAVIEAIRKLHPDMPVILLTGDLMALREDVTAGADGVLHKPVTQRDVREMVCSLSSSQPMETRVGDGA